MKVMVGLGVSYVRALLKPAKRKEEAFTNAKEAQVLEVMSIPLGMKAKTRRNF